MNQLDTLFRAILEEPWDDIQRLVYADCLEEAGQVERARFIRAQVTAARLPAGDPARGKLEREAEALVRGRKTAWKADLPKLKGVTWGPFERGFVDAALIRSAFMYHQQINRIVQAVPLELVQLRNASALGAIGKSRHSRRLRRLILYGLRLQPTALEGLVPSENLPRLEILELQYNSLGDDGAVHLASFPLPPGLRTLDLRDNYIRQRGALALARSAGLEGLQRLDLTGNPLGEEGRRALEDRFGNRVVLEKS
jgi:uncharacterized protein (TIGR02996 family)